MQKFKLLDTNHKTVTFNSNMPISQVPRYLHDEIAFAINSCEELTVTQKRLSENLGTNVTLMPQSFRNGFSMRIEFQVPLSIKAKSHLLNSIAASVLASKDAFEEAFSRVVEYTTCKVLMKQDSASINLQVNLLDTQMFPDYYCCSYGFGSYFTPDSPDPKHITETLNNCRGKGMDFYELAHEIHKATNSHSPVSVTIRYVCGAPCFDISRSRS